MEKDTPTTAPQQESVVKFEKNISDQVLTKINQFQKDGGLTLPQNYSVENHIKSAWLILQETKDRANNLALTVCTKDSIATALLDMVLQGLSVSKKQGYFIVYGKTLQFHRSYFGTVALAKRTGGLTTEPVANIIYEGDEFVFQIDSKTGLTQVVTHKQKLEDIDNTKIKAAYVIVQKADGTYQTTIMTMKQIQASWNQGAMKGNSPAHKNFTEEMAKKSVIGRACKMIINSSDDSWLYDGKRDEADTDTTKEVRNAEIKTSSKSVEINDIEFEDVTHTESQKRAENNKTSVTASQEEIPLATANNEEDPY